MGFEILVTEAAASDFDDAISYITLSLNNPSAAKALADDYDDALRRIADNPYLFHSFKDGEGNNTIYRRYNIRNFSLFYRVEGSRIIICRFLYARRDLYSVSIEA